MAANCKEFIWPHNKEMIKYSISSQWIILLPLKAFFEEYLMWENVHPYGIIIFMADKIGRALFSLACMWAYIVFWNKQKKSRNSGRTRLGSHPDCQWVSGSVSKYLSTAYFVPGIGINIGDINDLKWNKTNQEGHLHWGIQFTMSLDCVDRWGCLSPIGRH